MRGWVTFCLTCAEEGRRGLCKADGAVRETTRTPTGECLWGRPTVTCADNLQCSKQSCDSVFRVSHSRRFIQRESKNVDADNGVWILTLLFLQNWGGWGAASTSFPEGWCGWRRAGRYVLIHLFGFFTETEQLHASAHQEFHLAERGEKTCPQLLTHLLLVTKNSEEGQKQTSEAPC